MISRFRWGIGLLVGLIVMSTLAWPGETSTAQDEQPVRIAVAMSPPDSLEPLSLTPFDVTERNLLENLLVGLTRTNANTGQVEPWLARDWTVSDDGLVWTFALRDDVQWVQVQNGEPVALRPVVAGDVVFAIQRMCDPNRPSPQTANHFVIAGCRQAARLLDTERVSQAYLDENIGVRALDDTTLEVRLMFPAAYFLTLMSTAEFRPLPPEFTLGNSQWSPLDENIHSGPWVIEEQIEQRWQLVANPFWPADMKDGNIEEIELRFGVAEGLLIVQIDSGAVAMAQVSESSANAIRSINPELIRTEPQAPLTFIGFSFEYPPLDNPLVREALVRTIDRDVLAQELSSTSEATTYIAAKQFTPSNVLAAPEEVGAGFDVQAAQNLLSQAGYAQCAGFPNRLSLAVPAEMASIGQFVVEQWQQHLGCPSGQFEVVTAPRQRILDHSRMLIEEGVVNRFSLWLMEWTADYPDANGWMADALDCQVGYFRPGRACSPADSLLQQAGVLLDFTVRQQNYTQAEQAFFSPGGSFPVIPLVREQVYKVQQTWLRGVGAYGPPQFDRWQVEQ